MNNYPFLYPDELMPKRQKKVFSYRRFSSGSQASGSSLERQEKIFQKNFKEKYEPQGYRFDGSFVDKGVSSFRGKNVSKGNLGRIIELAKKGSRIREGDLIAIESLDRFSRDNPIKSLRRLFGIVIDLGIKIDFLDKEWIPALDRDNFEKVLHEIFNECQRSHYESKRRSENVTAALDLKKIKAREGKGWYSTQCPKWMKPKFKKGAKGKEIHNGFVVIPERKKVINKIYRWNLAGLGAGKIVNKLHEEKIPTFTDNPKWSRAYIEKILKSQSVLDIYQPQKKKYDENGKGILVDDGEPIKNYYGVKVISEELFYQVQRNKRILKGHSASNSKAKTETEYLFCGLLRCGYGQGEMLTDGSRKQKYSYYRTKTYRQRAKRKNDISNSWEVKDFEKQFLFFVTKLDWAKVLRAAKENKEQFDLNRTNELEGLIEKSELELQRYYDAVGELGLTDRLKAKIKKAEEERKKLENELAFEHEQLIDVHNAGDFTAMREVKNNIHKKKYRAELIINIQERIDSIELFGNGWWWNEKTFDDIIPFLCPDFIAKYRDCNNGENPKWNPKVLQNVFTAPIRADRPKSGKRRSYGSKNAGKQAGINHRFFKVNFKIGYSVYYVPEDNNYIFYEAELSDSQQAGLSNLSGTYERENFQFSPRGFRENFPYQEYEKFLNDRKRKTPAQDALKKLTKKVKAEQKEKQNELLKDDKQKLYSLVERDKRAKRFYDVPLNKSERTQLNKLKKQFPNDYARWTTPTVLPED